MNENLSVTANIEVDLSTLLLSAAQSAFGIIALIIIISSIVACVLFWNAGDKIRIIAFFLFFLGASAFGAAILEKRKTTEAQTRSESSNLEERKWKEIEDKKKREHELKIAKIKAGKIENKKPVKEKNDLTIVPVILKSPKHPSTSSDKYGSYSYYYSQNPTQLISHGWATGKSDSKEASSLAVKRCGDKRCKVDFTIKNKKCASMLFRNTYISLDGREDSKRGVCELQRERTGKSDCVIIKTICASDPDNWK